MIAALYVQRGGVYYGLPDVDPWDETRDARLYAGPHPVVAHPPCSRWCRLAGLVEARWGHRKGDDGGCFAAALASVRTWGGGARASRLLRRVACVRPSYAEPERGMAARHVRGLVVPRGARALRAPRQKSDVALRGRVRAAGPCVGLRPRRLIARAGVVVRQPRAVGRGTTARREARRLTHPARVPSPADGHGAVMSAPRLAIRESACRVLTRCLDACTQTA